ncbi:MAG: response regulator [Planctomycetota bacterium]
MAGKDTKRILIVDPDASVRNGLSRLLRRNEIDVATAVCGERALQRLREGETFDALILDVLLPDMYGKELVGAIASESLLPLSRVLILTAMQNVDNATAYLQYGCAAYCGKPYDNDQVLQQVLRILRGESVCREWGAIL